MDKAKEKDFQEKKSSVPAKKKPTDKSVNISKDRITEKPRPPIGFKEDVSFGSRLRFLENTSDNTINTAKNEKNENMQREYVAEYQVDCISESETKFDLMKREQLRFNKNLRKNPQNIELWIEFLNFQEKIFEKKTRLNERKISIVKKAIQMNPRSFLLIRLHLKFAEEIEDTTSLMKLWENYLHKFEKLAAETERKNSEFDDHWKLYEEYLIFRQNRFLAFNFEEVNEAFSVAFKIFKESENYVIQLFKMYILFLKRCGFRERIVGLCQACIEINVEYFNYGVIDVEDMEGYEDQWDAGVMEHIGDVVFRDFRFSSLLSFPENYNDSDGSNFSLLTNWIKLERYRELKYWHPIQYIHSEVEDLEGQVFFDDIKDFLVLIKNRSIKNNMNLNENINLSFVKIIMEALADGFDLYVDFENPKRIQSYVKNNSFLAWYFEVLKILSIHFKKDWKFNCCFFLIMNHFYKQQTCPEEAEIYAKNYLSNNRDCLEIFFAYGRYQQLVGNNAMALKVFLNLSKKSKSVILNFECELNSFIEQACTENIQNYDMTYPNHLELNFDERVELKTEIYDLVRKNPGNKVFYLQIIESVVAKDESLAMEVFNLLDEQQLRLHALLEEVSI